MIGNSRTNATSLALHIAKRFIHYRENPRKYPKVNVQDVVLDKPRFGFRKPREPLISQTVTDTLFPTPEIRKRYEEAGRPIPIKYRSKSDEIARRNYERYQDEVATGQPHFRMGERKIYFPKARICLLRPNAKHTPYQAKFLVPRNFNKMDLRDYLWNVYGLRALNVTTQLLHARFSRGPDDHARYRGPQFKKMTIDMEEPFIWPDLPKSLEAKAAETYKNQISAIEMKNAVGSDKRKPSDAFDGLYKKPILPNNYVPARIRRTSESKVFSQNVLEEKNNDKKIVEAYLGF